MKKFDCFCLYALALISTSIANAGTAYLDSWSAGDSTYYEYFSAGFVRMDLYSPDEPTHQSFHEIGNPSNIYNQAYDGFPNDNFLRFGSLEYDESTLVAGTGTATITATTLGIASDPHDSSYVNFSRFTTNTNVSSFAGTVEVVDNKPISIDFTADVELELTSVLGATQAGIYPGTFTIQGTTFEWDVHGTQNLDTFFGQADVELQWDFQGTTLITSDFDNDTDIDGQDFLIWQRNFGATGASPAIGDANLDTQVDDKDLTIWQTQFDRQAAVESAVTTVPEPSTALGLFWLVCATWRSRYLRSKNLFC